MPNRRHAPLYHRLIHEQRGNCFLYGCVTLVILTLLGGVIVFLSVRYLAREIREKYTAEAPVDLPTIDMPQSEIDALIERVDRYAKKLRDDEPLEPITLTQNDINALLQNHPDLKEAYGDHMYVELGESAVTAQMSLPLDWLPLFRNRYFNGKATFDVGFLGGKFQIYLNAASVKGESIPREQLREFRRQNFGDAWEDDADARELLRRIDDVEVKSSGVTIIPKRKAGESGEAPATAPSAADAPPAEEAQPDSTPAEQAPPQAA